ncbi:MAG: radical SAM protein [Rhodospirillales bacterium]|nr:radical SAM protein [Rhodospirillales bacterium]
MTDFDLILIAQSDVVDYDAYSKFPVDRLELFETMTYPRMVRHQGKFRSHLDILNFARDGKYYAEADYEGRRKLLNIWNLPSASGVHLANFLLGYGIKVKVINNIDSEWDWFVESYQKCSKPPLVGISSTFYLAWSQVKPIVKQIRQLDKDVKIVVGGALMNGESTTKGQPSFEKMMRKLDINYILHAFNSEFDLRDLILNLKNDRDTKVVANSCQLNASEISEEEYFVSPTKWHEPLLADAPASYDKLNLPFLNRTIQIRTASGCPFACSFCSYPVTAGGWKTLDIEHVRAHLDSVMRIPGIDRIIFIDDTFNVPKKRFKDLLKVFCEYDFEWFSFLRVQYVDDEVMSLMKESGCKGVYLGIESSNDVILENMNKKAKRADFIRGLELLNKYDILSLAAFVIGFPGETEETLQDNVDFIENYGIDYYSLKEFFYIPNTKVDQDRDKYNLTGMGAKWQHETMDSDTASRLKLEMFKKIKNSTFIDPDTSLWYFAYLYDQGFETETIFQAQTQINDLMLSQLSGDFSDSHPSYDNLKKIMANIR